LVKVPFASPTTHEQGESQYFAFFLVFFYLFTIIFFLHLQNFSFFILKFPNILEAF